MPGRKIGDAWLAVHGEVDPSRFRGEIDKGAQGAQLGRLGETHGRLFGSSFVKGAGALLGGLSAYFSVQAVTGFFKDTIAEAREAVKVGKITEAAIRSTGGAAKVSAGQVEELATALSNKAGVDDEVIQSGENLLLTFTRVRNEVGKGNDIFSQASSAIVDMTAAMNDGQVTTEGLKTSTIQVGKALQDPIKGITALARVGVTFSDQQKEQIANFVASGNIMGAQKVILKELATEFGGTAAAAADPAKKAAVAWANLKETIGGLVLPVLTRLGTFLTGTIIPAVQQFVAGLQGEGGGGAIGRFGVIIRDAFDGIRQAWNDLSKTFTAGQIKVLAAAVGALAVAVWAVTAPVSLVVVGIAALVVAFGYAYQHSALFRQIVDVVVAGLRMWADYMLWAWKNVWVPAFLAVRDAAVVLWSVLGPIFSAIGTAVLWLWQTIIYPSFRGWELLFRNVIGPMVMWLWRTIIEPAMAGIRLVIEVSWAAVRIAFGLVEIQVRAMATIFGWLWHNIVEPYFRGMLYVISQVWDGVRTIFDAFGGFIRDHVAPTFRTGVGLIEQAWNRIREVAAAPVRFVIDTVLNHGIIAGWNWLHDHLHVGDHIAPIGIPFAEGGQVRGPGTGTSDSIWARIPGGPFLKVSNGEYIVRAAAVNALGVPFLDSLNEFGGARRAKYPGDGSAGIGFAEGGFLGVLGDIWSVISDPVKAIAAPIRAAIGRTPGSGPFRDMVAGIGGRAVDGLVQAINALFTGVSGVVGGVVGGVNLAIARNLLLAAVGKPYGWAQAGPGSFDCSGVLSMVWNALHGRSPYVHTFSTSNEAGFFPIPGIGGALTAGWTNPGEPGPGGDSVGHTAGLLAGILPFESTGGVGVRVGAGVTPVGRFAHIGHFDTGGWLAPGWTAAYNGTGRPEPVGGPVELGPATIRRLAAAIAAGVGGEINGVGRSVTQMARAR